MTPLISCSACHGFMGATDAVCPHCEKPRPPARSGLRWAALGSVAMMLGGSAFAMTLMACYGCPPTGCGGPYEPPDLLPPADDLLTPADGSCTDSGAGCSSDGGIDMR